MIINHNMNAMNAHRMMGMNINGAGKSMEKLSSGLRINRAGDDAAGLAISEKMRGQIRGLDQASRNAQDGISLIQTAEGGLNETHSILQRMRELSVQSSNDTNNDADRGQIQKEIEQLKSEIDRISTDTEFNTKKLLNGDVGQVTTKTDAGTNIIAVRAVDGNLEGTNTVMVSAISLGVDNFVAAGGVQKSDVTVKNVSAGSGLSAGKYTVEINGAVSNATAYLKDANGKVIDTVKAVNTANDSITFKNASTSMLSITKGKYNGVSSTLSFDVTISANGTFTDAKGKATAFTSLKANSNSTMNIGGFELDVDTSLQAKEDGSVKATLDVKNNGVYFQIGANEAQTTRLAVNKMDTKSLLIDDVDLTTQSGAEAAITKVNKAIENVSTERSKLGAIQNRLEHTINNLSTSSENLQSAESRIRDVDMAKEMMNFSKNNILSQAAQAMLAQANNQPQGVLQLLR